MKTYYLYILTNYTKSSLYIGITNNLERRMYEHKNGLCNGFSKKYHTHELVYYETTDDINAAIITEKRLKKWKRIWKDELITNFNPRWEDLSKDWF